MNYSYQSQKLSEARRALMLPCGLGEARAITIAFHACSCAFNNLDENQLEEKARDWICNIKNFMSTIGIVDDLGEDTLFIKAQSLSKDEQRELSDSIDELAHWFNRYRG